MTDTITDVEMRPVDSLIPYTNNPKEHPDEQVQKIASSIKNFGWDQPIVVDGENEIIKGHGRMQAAKRLGLDEVPVIERPDLTEAEARAARIADNKTAESEWDEELLSVELEQSTPEFDADELGFNSDELDSFLDKIATEGEADEDRYTDKIETPEYEPTGPKPHIADLYDAERYRELHEKVQDADVPEELRQFLVFAAQRHIIFDYENIAEYYAHADAEAQELMEALTLVIVDYDQAIEQGFVDFADSVLSEANDA